MRRVMFVARNRYRLPLSPSLRLKWDALARVFDVRVVASSPDASRGDETFHLRPRSSFDGPRFWLSLPGRIRREAREFRPDAIVAQSPFEAAAALVARTGVPVIVELHGDWRTFGRLYGSGARRAIGREPAATFPAFMDLQPFAAPPKPLPPETIALFIGVLEPYKNIDGLAEAWRSQRPNAELRIVGKGTRTDVVATLVRDGLATWQPELSTDEIVRVLDEAAALILPSRSEGMGRVVIEAQLRGRPVLGSNVGGIPDLVTHGVDGVLFDPARIDLAVLNDRTELERLAANARAAGERWLVSPDEYAARMRDLVDG